MTKIPARIQLAGALCTLALLLPACATSDGPDPWVGMNRGIFSFNEGVDRYALEPVASGWDAAVPEVVQTAVGHFFENLDQPRTFANDLLQGKPVAALQDLGRFALNSTLGLAGLFDVATIAEIPSHDEDLGQTLGAWGVGPGPYFVIPLLGPSTLRDALVKPVDSLARPQDWLLPLAASIPLGAVQLVNQRAAFLEEIREDRKSALDYYVFVRNAWLQHREARVRDGAGEKAADDLYYFDE